VEELAEVGSRLEEAQAQVDASSSRAQRLDLQNQRLRTCANRLTTLAFGVSPNGYAASLLSVVTFATRLLAQPLNEDLEDQREAAAKSIQFNDYPRRTLEDTARRLERKKAEYRKSREEHQNRAEEPRRREAALEDSVGRLGSKKEQMEARIARLRAEERPGRLQGRQRAIAEAYRRQADDDEVEPYV
jgi:hypothetical protein